MNLSTLLFVGSLLLLAFIVGVWGVVVGVIAAASWLVGALVIAAAQVEMREAFSVWKRPRATEEIKLGQLVRYTDQSKRHVEPLGNAERIPHGIAVSSAKRGDTVRVIQNGTIHGIEPPDDGIYFKN